MEPQQTNVQIKDPFPQEDHLDSEEIPLEYRQADPVSKRTRRGDKRGRASSGNFQRVQSALTSSGDTSKEIGGRGSENHYPARKPTSLIGLAISWLPSPKRLSTNNKYTQTYKADTNADNILEEVHHGTSTNNQQNQALKNHREEGKVGFQDIIDSKEREWAAKERVLRARINHNQRDLEETKHIFEGRLQEKELEIFRMQEEHNDFIRKQQEELFKQMDSARWLPKDEGEVMGDLDRLKRNMRSWAKVNSIKDDSAIQAMTEVGRPALMQELAHVVVLENGQLPEGLLTTARAPVLLLNALLAHNVYTNFFRSPFSFLGNGNTSAVSNIRREAILEEIYERSKDANRQDANIWRSQTLRLLMPPLRNDSTVAEKELHHQTENLIAEVADRKALDFLASAASYLLDNDTKTDFTKKLKKIYNDAAKLSYTLWTGRTEMKLVTLHMIKNLAFDAESVHFEPDSLVRYEDHEDHLKGKPISVMVHPLLIAYGTEEAQEYDMDRVWTKGVVWLQSRNAAVKP